MILKLKFTFHRFALLQRGLLELQTDDSNIEIHAPERILSKDLSK
jgi:hypothetical protein